MSAIKLMWCVVLIAGAHASIVPRVVKGNQRCSVVKEGHADLFWEDASPFSVSMPVSRAIPDRKVMTSEHVRINYPQSLSSREIEDLMRLLETSRSTLQARLKLNRIVYSIPAVEVFVNTTTGDFVGQTGQASWAAAVTKGERIELQPLKVLRDRGILETTIRHELVHIAIDGLGHNQSPRWLAEGLAMYVAGEGVKVSDHTPASNYDSLEDLNRALNSAKTPESMKAAYTAAYYEVRRLVRREGEGNVWKRIEKSGF